MTEGTWLWRLLLRGTFVLVLASGLVCAQAASAQDETAEQGEAEMADSSGEAASDPAGEESEADAEAEEADLFTEEQLDTLVAPYALYPDSLLAQVFMASTFPLDIVKAERWVEENEDLEGEARGTATEAEDWDPSVAVLAAGFPSVIDAMSAELDSTEDLGNALLAQSDDVFDAVQRQRARAAAMGNLESNEAQTVEVEDDVITVEPADPEVVYVPTYDSQQVYTTQAPAAVQPVVVESDDSGSDAAALITTGLLSFGAGMLVNELFDDDDWDDYWRGPRVDWNDGSFYPRPGINVDGDVNIDVDRGRFDGNRVDIGEDGRWQPDKERRDQARDKIRDRKGEGKLAGAAGDRGKLTGGKASLPQRDGSRAKLDQKLKARTGGEASLGKAKGNLSSGKAKPSLSKKASALQAPKKASLSSAKKASNRGKVSKAKSRKAAPSLKGSSTRKAVGKPSGKQRASISKPKRSSALKRGGGGGRKASASKSRGSKSRGKRGKRR